MIDLIDIGRFYGETIRAARNMRSAVYEAYRQEDPDLLNLKMEIDRNMETIELYYQILQTEREALKILQAIE